jgi:hypothetical protein
VGARQTVFWACCICTSAIFHPVPMSSHLYRFMSRPNTNVSASHLYWAEPPPGTNVRYLYRVGWIRPRRASVRGHLYYTGGKNIRYKCAVFVPGGLDQAPTSLCERTFVLYRWAKYPVQMKIGPGIYVRFSSSVLMCLACD